MTLTKSTPVRLARSPYHRGVICRFIGDRPVVAWVGDNDITDHDPDELIPDHEALAKWRNQQGDSRA